MTRERLAGVLAWSVPGSRDVINGLEEVLAEEDNDDELTGGSASSWKRILLRRQQNRRKLQGLAWTLKVSFLSKASGQWRNATLGAF